MDVEDFIEAIASRLTNIQWRRARRQSFGGLFDNDWHRSFIFSVTDHVRMRRPLSSNQSKIILKMIDKARAYLVEYQIADEMQIATVLARPSHRQEPHESNNVPREVRYIGNNLLAFRCKANPLITEAIKAFGNPPSSNFTRIPSLLRVRPRFDWTHKIWIVPVFRFNLTPIRQCIFEHRFRYDAEVSDYLAICEESRDKPSFFLFADEDEQTMLLANVCDDYILAAWVTEMAGGIIL